MAVCNYVVMEDGGIAWVHCMSQRMKVPGVWHSLVSMRMLCSCVIQTMHVLQRRVSSDDPSDCRTRSQAATGRCIPSIVAFCSLLALCHLISLMLLVSAMNHMHLSHLSDCMYRQDSLHNVVRKLPKLCHLHCGVRDAWFTQLSQSHVPLLVFNGPIFRCILICW